MWIRIFIDNTYAHIFITVILFTILFFMCRNAARRFEGTEGVRIYIICSWGFLILFIFAATTINHTVLFYVLSLIGYIGAFAIISRAFKAAKKIRQKHIEKSVEYYNENSYDAHYIKCSSCGNKVPPGTMFCSKCNNRI